MSPTSGWWNCRTQAVASLNSKGPPENTTLCFAFHHYYRSITSNGSVTSDVASSNVVVSIIVNALNWRMP